MTIYWGLLIVVDFILIKKNLITKKVRFSILIASFIGTLFISFGALIGSHISQ